MPTSGSNMSYWDAVVSIVTHPIESIKTITSDGPGAPTSISDYISNGYVQMFTGQELTGDELNAIETATYNDALKAGGSIADATKARQQVHDFYVQNYGEPDTTTKLAISDWIDSAQKWLVIGVILLGAGILVYGVHEVRKLMVD